MNKNTQILLGVGILGLGGYLYWKSTQKQKNMVGFIKQPSQRVFSADATLPKQFFNVKSSPNAVNNFKNASGIFEPMNSKKIFANMTQPMGTQNCGHTGSWNC